MYAGRRIAALRVTALAALAVSAILAADTLHPGRAFCPLAAACEKARSSALGKILGIPTSVHGMVAFGGLFLLSMLKVETSRRLLRPAGFLAAVVGAGLFGYQAIVIRSFCPLCLVADTAGLVAGLIVLTWPKTPIRRSGRKLPAESLVARLRWATVATLVVAAPFLWPRPEKPSWVELPGGLDIATLEMDDGPGLAAASVAGDDAGSPRPAKPARRAYEPDPDAPIEVVANDSLLPPPHPSPTPAPRSSASEVPPPRPPPVRPPAPVIVSRPAPRRRARNSRSSNT